MAKIYSHEVIDNINTAFNKNIWDGFFWIMNRRNFSSNFQAAKVIAKETNMSTRWIMRGMQVYRKFFEIKNTYPNLTFQHFLNVVSLDYDIAIRWLDKAHDENWTAKKLYSEIRKENMPQQEEKKFIELKEKNNIEEKENMRKKWPRTEVSDLRTAMKEGKNGTIIDIIKQHIAKYPTRASQAVYKKIYRLKYSKNSSCLIWSSEEKAYVILRRNQKASYRRIRKELWRKFNSKRSSDAVYAVVHNNTKIVALDERKLGGNTMLSKKFYWTKEEKDYLQHLTTVYSHKDDIIEAFGKHYPQRTRNAVLKYLYQVSKKRWPNEKTTSHWSEEEDKELLESRIANISPKEISSRLNQQFHAGRYVRTIDAAVKRLDKLHIDKVVKLRFDEKARTSTKSESDNLYTLREANNKLKEEIQFLKSQQLARIGYEMAMQIYKVERRLEDKNKELQITKVQHKELTIENDNLKLKNGKLIEEIEELKVVLETLKKKASINLNIEEISLLDKIIHRFRK